jgi:hypothetical protein
MRGALMRLFTEAQHLRILQKYQNNTEAANAYHVLSGKRITESNVQYWRNIFQVNNGNLSATDRALKEHRKLIVPHPDDDFGITAYIPDKEYDSILVIPDMHAPYEHPQAIDFLLEVKKLFKPDVVINLGDELDYHALSFHDSDPNLDSAGVELEKGKLVLQRLYKAFPNLSICHSNHSSMYYRKARAHGIPVQMIKKYRDTLFPESGCPGWSWAYNWKVHTALGPVLFQHQSPNPVHEAAHNHCNLMVGHNHSLFGVAYSASASAGLYWGGHSGCLVDARSLAFLYGQNTQKKPILGCTVILKGRPMPIPMILNNHEWIGRV